MRPSIQVLWITALLGACTSAPSVRVDRAPNFTPGQCKTFAWLPAGDVASFTEQRVRAAVMQSLERKGYTQVAEQPDCQVTYLLSSNEPSRRKPSIGVGAGGGSGGVGGGIGVNIPVGQRGRAAQFTLDIIDARAKAQIWSGQVEAAVEESELNEEEARDLAETVLREFPDRK